MLIPFGVGAVNMPDPATSTAGPNGVSAWHLDLSAPADHQIRGVRHADRPQHTTGAPPVRKRAKGGCRYPLPLGSIGGKEQALIGRGVDIPARATGTYHVDPGKGLPASQLNAGWPAVREHKGWEVIDKEKPRIPLLVEQREVTGHRSLGWQIGCGDVQQVAHPP